MVSVLTLAPSKTRRLKNGLEIYLRDPILPFVRSGKFGYGERFGLAVQKGGIPDGNHQ